MRIFKRLMLIVGVLILIPCTEVFADNTVGVAPSYLKIDLGSNRKGQETIKVKNMEESKNPMKFTISLDGDEKSKSYFKAEGIGNNIAVGDSIDVKVSYDIPSDVTESELDVRLHIQVEYLNTDNSVTTLVEVPIFTKLVDNVDKPFDVNIGGHVLEDNSYAISSIPNSLIKMIFFSPKEWVNVFSNPLKLETEKRIVYDDKGFGKEKLHFNVTVPIKNNNDYSIVSAYKSTMTTAESGELLLESTVGNIIVQKVSSSKASFPVVAENVEKLKAAKEVLVLESVLIPDKDKAGINIRNSIKFGSFRFILIGVPIIVWIIVITVILKIVSSNKKRKKKKMKRNIPEVSDYSEEEKEVIDNSKEKLYSED